MEIRLLKPLDAEIYLRIRLEALKNSPEAFAASYQEEKNLSVEVYKNRFQAKDSFTFGAFDKGKLVGIITLVKEKRYKLRHRANIVGMYVSPEIRGNRIGKALVTEAIKLAKDLEGVEQIKLSVVSTNQHAKRLYSSMGFKVYATEESALN
ncbi:GNAT family N-acetyltransferase [Neobacillus sp. LXY-4]|uniref:GNAT family N-acetyltransferase n=1 Tax=Neobacillus sp. LXY-4 TaxID=3379826 RepID=UPI003EE212FE